MDLGLILVCVICASKNAFASSTDYQITSSTTGYGAYGVQHDLRLWMAIIGNSMYAWHADCDHYAINIYNIGEYCYCNCVIEDRGNVIDESGRDFAAYEGGRYHSKTRDVYDKSVLWRAHAYYGTIAH